MEDVNQVSRSIKKSRQVDKVLPAFDYLTCQQYLINLRLEKFITTLILDETGEVLFTNE